MRQILLSTFFIVLSGAFISLVAYNPTIASAEDSLDGKTFTIKLMEHGKDGEPSDDELIFKDGTFFSTDCEQYGFSPAPYTASSDSGTTTFESTLVSEKEGKNQWKGTVTGDKISGVSVWSKEGQDSITYHYEGTLK